MAPENISQPGRVNIVLGSREINKVVTVCHNYNMIMRSDTKWCCHDMSCGQSLGWRQLLVIYNCYNVSSHNGRTLIRLLLIKQSLSLVSDKTDKISFHRNNSLDPWDSEMGLIQSQNTLMSRAAKGGDRESENQLEQLSSSGSLVTIRLVEGWRMYIARCQEAGDMPPGANPRHMHQHWHQINTDLGPVVQRLLLGLCCLCQPLTRDEQQSSGSRY